MIGAQTMEGWEEPSTLESLIREYGWATYIGLCLLLWGVLITAPGTWLVALTHWPMALVMIGGSLVAGSTPMGGGTIAFPALVLGFGESPAMARDFGLAIQSIGMTSALLFIVMRGIPVERRMLIWSCAGAVVGLTLGTYLLAGRVPADWVKLLFATLWITFGGWLVTGTAKATAEPRPSTEGTNVAIFGLIVGVVGGAVASLIGVGVEMLVYATLVLRFGWGPKAAVPTAVCATALVSPVGLVLRAMTAGIHPMVFPTWMACVPIVIFGAPAGAYISTRMPRPVLLRIIGALVLVQFAVTVNQVRPSLAMWGGVLVIAALSGVGLWLLAPSTRKPSEPSERPTFELSQRLAEVAVNQPKPAPAERIDATPSRALLGLDHHVEPMIAAPPPDFDVVHRAPVADGARPTRVDHVEPVARAAPPAAAVRERPVERREPAPFVAPIATPVTPPVAAAVAAPATAPLVHALDVQADDAAAPFLAYEAESMDGGNLYHFYHLGVRLHPLGGVAEGQPRHEWIRRQSQNTAFLAGALAVEQSPLAAVRQEASRLLHAVQALGARDESVITASEARAIQTALREFERALFVQLRRGSVFHVQRVGIHDTALLVGSADEMFAPDVWIRLSAKTRTDWCAAGRCLAMRLNTACGFHVMRATEAVIHDYYAAVTGHARIKRKDRDWGAYTRGLTRHRRMHPGAHVDAKLIALIEFIRSQHANPVSEPDATLDANEAYALFNLAHTAIVSFVTATSLLAVQPATENVTGSVRYIGAART